MLPKIVVWAGFVLPWLSLFFMPMRYIRRYTPVALFTLAVLILYSGIAGEFRFWEVYVDIVPLLKPAVSFQFLFGSYFIGVMWIFRFTEYHFWRYVIVNVLIDLFFAFPATYILDERLGIFSWINMNAWMTMVIFTGIALLLYAFQVWIRPIFKEDSKP